MSTLTRSRHRAEELAALVDGGPAPSRPAPAGSAARAELDRLVDVVTVLRERATADEAARPGDAFTAELRERLMAEAREVLGPQQSALVLPARPRGRRERRLVAAATVAVLLGGSAGMAAAAQGSLPGEALYPIKRGLENVRTDLATSPAAQGRSLLAQAGDRLTEAEGLSAAGGGAESQLAGTVATFTRQARQGADLMLTAYADDRDPETVAQLRSFAARDQARIARLAATAPPSAEAALRRAATTLHAIDTRASQACADCSALPPLRMPATFRAGAEALRAMNALDKAHVTNDHPVIAPRDAVHQADAGAAGPAAGSLARRVTGSGLPTAGPTPTDPQPPSPTKVPTAGGGLPAGTSGASPSVTLKLPSLGPTTGGTGGLGGSVGSGGSGGGDLGAGLGETVETLLPDLPTTPPSLP